MISLISNFFNRHKRKVIFGASFMAIIVFIKKLFVYKMVEWHQREAQALIRKQKRKEHYEKSKQTAEVMTLSMAESLRRIIMQELDSDSLLQAIRQNPSNKQLTWDELKIVAFSRIMSSVYVSALSVTIIHVKIMVLSAYSFQCRESSNDAEYKTRQSLYLESIQKFIETGVPVLIKNIHKTVSKCIHALPLTQEVNMEQLEVILHDISLELAGEFFEGDNTHEIHTLQPWNQYCIDPSDVDGVKGVEVKELLLETKDVVNCEDFNSVVNGLIQQGMNHILDYVSECYPHPGYIKNANEGDDKGASHVISNITFNKTKMPVAKLIPILVGIIHNCLSAGPGQLLQMLTLNPRLEAFSNNIYSAFCFEA